MTDPPTLVTQIGQVFARDAVQFLRQRAVVLRIALLPVLYVAIAFVTPSVLSQHQGSAAQPQLRVSTTAAVAATPFGQFLRSLPGYRVDVAASPRQRVSRDEADLAVVATASGGVTLSFDPERERSRLALAITSASAANFNLVQTLALLPAEQVVTARQALLQAQPRSIRGRDVRKLATLGSLLGFALLAFIARSSNALAIEKDRRTAEALLVLPLSSAAIVLGKAAHQLAQAATTSVIAIAAAIVGGQVAGADYHLNHSAAALVLTMVDMLTVAALLIATGALIGTLVRGVTESAVWTSFAALPMVAAAVTLPFIESPAAWLRWLPFFGQFRGMQDALTGTPSWVHEADVGTVTAALVVVLLALATRWLRSDNAVLRATT
ncbi:MAG TPA: ABC transporter permease [Acidimicrobiales bacterium]|nr:ABC transporter permease [Acidimicrobiales bacterium]